MSAHTPCSWVVAGPTRGPPQARPALPDQLSAFMRAVVMDPQQAGAVAQCRHEQLEPKREHGAGIGEEERPACHRAAERDANGRHQVVVERAVLVELHSSTRGTMPDPQVLFSYGSSGMPIMSIFEIASMASSYLSMGLSMPGWKSNASSPG